jgi:hypothetical protein
MPSRNFFIPYGLPDEADHDGCPNIRLGAWPTAGVGVSAGAGA